MRNIWIKTLRISCYTGHTKGFAYKCTLLKHVQFQSYFRMAVGQFEALFQTLRLI